MTGGSPPSGDADDDRRGKSFVLARWSISVWLAVAALVAFIVCLVVGIVVENEWGTAAESAGVPLFALVFGAFAADAYYRKEGEKKVQEKVRLAAYTTLNIQYALTRAHEPIRAAVDGAYALGSVEQVGELRAAEMAVHLAHGASLQALHELNALALDDSVIRAVQAQFDANSESLTVTRPRVQLGDNPRTAGTSEDGSTGESDPNDEGNSENDS